jgi:hypothetical protein
MRADRADTERREPGRAFQRLLLEPVTIQRPSLRVLPHEATYTTIGTVQGRLAPLSAQEALLLGARASRGRWKIVLPAATDVQPRDRLTLSGRMFDVASGVDARPYEMSRVVTVTEVVEQVAELEKPGARESPVGSRP